MRIEIIIIWRIIINQEIWKDIKGYEGYYQVSNLGNVKSLDRYIKRNCDNKERFIKGVLFSKILNADGYYQVKLSKDNTVVPYRIHRLVAEVFIPNPNNMPEVNHIDCDRTNNCVDNLEWCTHHENVLHSASLGKYQRFGKNNPNYGNHILSEIYKNNHELAIEKLSRPQAQNGRAKIIKLYDNERNYIDTFDWIGGCAEYLIKNNFTNGKINSVRGNILIAVKNNKLYLNHYYEFA